MRDVCACVQQQNRNPGFACLSSEREGDDDDDAAPAAAAVTASSSSHVQSPLSQYLSLAAKGVCDTTLASPAPLFPPTGMSAHPPILLTPRTVAAGSPDGRKGWRKEEGNSNLYVSG